MEVPTKYCPCCKRPFECGLDRRIFEPEQALKLALDENEFAFYDLFSKPPLSSDGWTNGGEFRENITDADVDERAALIAELIRDHGRRNKWTAKKIEAAVKRGANPMLEVGDPKLSRYIDL